MTQRNESYEELARAFGVLVPDPDPDRKTTYCMDCRTPSLVVTPGPTGPMLVIEHDSECPAYAAMPEDDRTLIDDDGALVHTCRQEVADWAERQQSRDQDV